MEVRTTAWMRAQKWGLERGWKCQLVRQCLRLGCAWELGLGASMTTFALMSAYGSRSSEGSPRDGHQSELSGIFSPSCAAIEVWYQRRAIVIPNRGHLSMDLRMVFRRDDLQAIAQRLSGRLPPQPSRPATGHRCSLSWCRS